MKLINWIKQKWTISKVNRILKKAKKEGRKVYLTADQHFFHGNIIRYCNRPFRNYRKMNEFMIKQWNSVVRKEDVVLHLGDFAFKNKAGLIIPQLNGKIILLRGNHDKNLRESRRLIILEGNLIINNFILSHRPLPKEEIPTGMTNVFGHIHHNPAYSGICVCVEKTNYKPVLLSSLTRLNLNNQRD